MGFNSGFKGLIKESITIFSLIYSNYTFLSNPGGARFSAPVQTGPGAHPASCTMGTGSFPGGKERPGRDAVPSPPSSAVGHEIV